MCANSPIVLEYAKSVEVLDRLQLYTVSGNRVYAVPTSYPDTRYRIPSGLGATIATNSVIQMYPDVNQYLVSVEDRVPKANQEGFLCVCSGSPLQL